MTHEHPRDFWAEESTHSRFLSEMCSKPPCLFRCFCSLACELRFFVKVFCVRLFFFPFCLSFTGRRQLTLLLPLLHLHLQTRPKHRNAPALLCYPTLPCVTRPATLQPSYASTCFCLFVCLLNMFTICFICLFWRQTWTWLGRFFLLLGLPLLIPVSLFLLLISCIHCIFLLLAVFYFCARHKAVSAFFKLKLRYYTSNMSNRKRC